MSDFLSNLAARSLTALPVFRPRLASLFEPVRGTALGSQTPPESVTVPRDTAINGIELEIMGLDRATDAEPGSAFRSHRKRRLSNEGEDAADEAPTEPMPSQKMMEEDRLLAVSLPRTLRRSSPMHDNLESQDTRTTEAAVERDGRSLRPQALEVRKISPASGERRPQFSPPAPDLLLPLGAAQVIASERARSGGQPSGSQEANGKRNSADAQISLSQRSLQDRKHAAARPAVESEPTIQVTIGRVEVRAEMASASPRRAEKKASPVMDLEEYLRRRARRGSE